MSLDFGHFPRNQTCDIAIFPGTVFNASVEWSVWHKPRGCSMAHMLLLSGGGGGGGGFTRAAGNAGGGGGGGGSSALCTLTIPIHFLPDVLYIQAGVGGAGSTGSGVLGSGGGRSYVSVAPFLVSTVDNIVAISGATNPGGGGAGSDIAPGAAGSASSVPVIGSMPRGALGQFTLIAGQAGAAGGTQTGAAGGNITIPTTGIVVTGGTGGGGTTSADFAGGQFASTAGSLLSDSRPIFAAAGSNYGSGGVTLWKPFFNFGGCGGGSANASAGGRGGNAAFGCGGGGGGAGTTGGAGGNGGPGLVIITSW